MHYAPLVTITAGRFACWPRYLALMALAAALGPVVGWQLGHLPGGVALASGGCAGLAMWLARREHQPNGLLRHADGQWTWCPQGDEGLGLERPVRPECVLDAGDALCLRLGPWHLVWLRREDAPQAWHGLRCALYGFLQRR